MNKKYFIFGALGAALIGAYLIWKKNKPVTAEEILESSMDEAGKQLSSLYTANQKAVDASQYTQADIDYNDAVRRYQLKYKTQPDKSWTTDEIEQRIADYDKIQEYISEYLKLEAMYDEGNTVLTNKELGRMNASELKQLIQKLTDQNKRTAWNRRKVDLETLVSAFKANMTSYGTWLWDCRPYDYGVLESLLNLPKNEKVYANEYFRKLGGVPVGNTWLQYTKHSSIASSISAALPEPGSSVDRDRAGKTSAGKDSTLKMTKAVKEAYNKVSGSVNEYGEIV